MILVRTSFLYEMNTSYHVYTNHFYGSVTFIRKIRWTAILHLHGTERVFVLVWVSLSLTATGVRSCDSGPVWFKKFNAVTKENGDKLVFGLNWVLPVSCKHPFLVWLVHSRLSCLWGEARGNVPQGEEKCMGCSPRARQERQLGSSQPLSVEFLFGFYRNNVRKQARTVIITRSLIN